MAHRSITLDTETTGLSPAQGHRIIEIGCVEMVDRELTGEHFQVYLQPDRLVDPGAQRVHGISDDFLVDKPRFSEVMADFLAFVDGAEVIIHNAPFDVGFLSSEFALAGHEWSDFGAQFKIIDTLAMARAKHPGQKNNLDALCRRYEINNSHRTLHGALLDSEILAELYLVMTGGQTDLSFSGQSTAQKKSKKTASSAAKVVLGAEALPVLKASDEENKAHAAYMETIAGKD